jgi:hypothetical protein
MNRALLAKELRALSPYAGCLVAFVLLNWIHSLITEAPDLQRFNPEQWMDKSRSGSLITLAFFSLLLGAGLLMQEREQRTLFFLDGLPVSRTRIFFIKVLAAVLVIALEPLLDFGSDVGFGLLSRTSIDAPFPWSFVLVQFTLQLIAGTFLIAVATLLSFTGAWFALLTGLLLWAYLWLRERGIHWLALLDTYALLSPQYVGSRVFVPWRSVAAHLTGIVAMLTAAWIAFLSLGDRAQFVVERLGRVRILSAFGIGMRWMAPVIWIAVLVKLANMSNAGRLPESDSPVGEEAFSRHETKHYEFLFRTAQTSTARPLFEVADFVYTQVADFLGAAPTPGRVIVDLASPVISHAAAQTNWTKIRMPISEGMALDEEKLILGHETTHVFIEQLSEGSLSGHFNAIRFLHEGLATYVELRLFGTDEDRARNRREIAGAWSRGKVTLEQLMDNTALSKTREPNLDYPLGFAFAQALVYTYGQSAPANLLRAFARKGAPSGLKGPALWRDTMQAAGFNLDRVAAAYDSVCDSALSEEKDFVATLPRLSATVGLENGEIIVRPTYEGEAPGQVVCFTEDDKPLAPQWVALRRRLDGSFAWPRKSQTSPVFRYLLGWRTSGTRVPVFEPWGSTVLE